MVALQMAMTLDITSYTDKSIPRNITILIDIKEIKYFSVTQISLLI